MSGIKGKTFSISGTKTGGNTWLPLTGVNSRSQTRDNPVSDSTSQAVAGHDASSAFTGYGSISVEFSGTIDRRAGPDLFGWDDLQRIVWSADPVGLFKLSTEGGIYESDFTITNLQKTAESNDLVKFSGSMQNKREMWRVPAWYDALEFFNNVQLPDAWEAIEYGTDFS